jgi:plasmid stabilization system protein ParE
MKRQRWLRRALIDWRATMLFEAQRSQSQARAIIAALDRAMRLLQENPHLGSPTDHEPRLLQWFIREAQLWIYYVPSDEEIAIHRIKPARTKSFRPGIDF